MSYGLNLRYIFYISWESSFVPCLNFTLIVPSKKKKQLYSLGYGTSSTKTYTNLARKSHGSTSSWVSHNCHWVVLLQILATKSPKSPSYCPQVVLIYKLCFARTTRTLSLRLWDSHLFFLVENQRLWDSPILEVGSSSSVYINGLDQILNLLREVQSAWPTKPLRLAIGSLSSPI